MTRLLSAVLACVLLVGCISSPSQNVVHVARDGEITVNGVVTSRDALADKLDKGTPVVIQASPQASHRDVVDILNVARRAGVKQVSVSAEAVK